MKYGRFPSIAAFLNSYEADLQQSFSQRDARATSHRARVINRLSERNVVEVKATLFERQPDDNDGDRHVRLLINAIDVVENDNDVAADIQRVRDGGEKVFVAIRIGDRMGIMEPIEGLNDGAALHLRGEWIPKDKAQAHGGEPMSVLHFTHHPIGFTCVAEPERCYS